MSDTFEEQKEAFLEHVGVKGMKWGKRKARDNSPNSSYTSAQRNDDKAILGRGGVKRVNRAMNEGKTREQAFKAEATKQIGVYAAVGLAGVALKAGVAYVDKHPEVLNRAMNTINGTKSIDVGYQVVKTTLTNIS